MVVPPPIGPDVGDTEVSGRRRRDVGEGARQRRRLRVGVGDLHARRRRPRPAGVVARSCVALTKVTPVAATPPTRTVAPETKFAPVSVIVVPPGRRPEAGDTEVSVGAGAT